MGITRRDFTALGGITVMVSFAGCGGDDDEGDFTIGGNHQDGPHSLFLPASDLDSPVAKTYDIGGQARHNHTVTFTPAQLQALKAGQRISSQSSLERFDLHEHQVVVFAPAAG
jgi:hypothetical protein